MRFEGLFTKAKLKLPLNRGLDDHITLLDLATLYVQLGQKLMLNGNLTKTNSI